MISLPLFFAGHITGTNDYTVSTSSHDQPIVMDEKLLGKAFFMDQNLAKKKIYSIKSDEFNIERRFINFRISGHYNPFRTCLNLWINGKIVRSSTADGTGKWKEVSWSVEKYKGQKAFLQVVDADLEKGKDISFETIIQENEAKSEVTGAIIPEVAWAKKLAFESLNKNVKKANEDPNRPQYHFMPPSQRMNDPNGTFYANGYYHLFYQYNPLADYAGGGYMLWGHARSKDMVIWEHLPIALWPDWESGELQCYSGGAYKNYKGENMLFYTSVPAPGLPRTQHAVVSKDKDYLSWQPYHTGPLMDYPLDGPDPGHNWRDPFIFEDGGKVFALLTTNSGVNIYESLDQKLTKWVFRNTIFKTKGAPECPNFFRFGKEWMLIVSPQNPVVYSIGDFDTQTATFKPRRSGTLNTNNHFYATQGLVDGQGRQILFGLIKGFKNHKGWRDCAALPRVLTIAADGTPRQLPISELSTLRGKQTKVEEGLITSERQVLKSIKGDLLELQVEIQPKNSKACGIRVRCAADGKSSFEIRYENGRLILPGSKIASAKLPVIEGKIKLSIFIDKGAIEVFSADGRVAEVRTYYAGTEDLGVELFTIGGEAYLQSLNAWQMNPAKSKGGINY